MISSRQVHLDFHTTEHIPYVAMDFQPDAFANMVKDAHINSMTVFARCHHGWLYYPSEQFPELIHPTLQNHNLLLEQVQALHKVGVKAPVYITVQWDYHSATAHPEWLVRKPDGAHEGDVFSSPGFYQSLCINTGYRDFLKAHTQEVCSLLGEQLDGLFFDIVGIRPCSCATCRAKMQAEGLDYGDEATVRAFTKRSLDEFKADMTALVRRYNKHCTIFYNAGHVGPCTLESAKDYTHFELESLPSGTWGYLHFPVTARYARKLAGDCLGMTGKFHTEWGDFHSLKNQAALEFEAFRMLSHGFACSIGDQLEPNGLLGPATYRLIGNVYKQFEQYEPWARPSCPLTEVAVLTPESHLTEFDIPESVFGATQLLEELAIQFDIIDPAMGFSDYRLLILPDDLLVDQLFAKKLDDYVAHGGKVIATAKGGLCGGHFPTSFGVDYCGEQTVYPDFVLPSGNLGEGLEEDSEYVIYLQGETIQPVNAQVLMQARAPYFKRAGDRFCSHRYTPSAKGEGYPAVCQNGNVIYFTHPLFTQYRTNAPRWCKQLIKNAVKQLLQDTYVSHDGPSTMTVSLLHQPEQKRINAHLLSYIPVRKSATIDVIEERTVLHDVTLQFNVPYAVHRARLVPDGTVLPIQNGQVTVPKIDGYAVLELCYDDQN